MTTSKTCTECGAPIYGRLDKKFCSDQCRNVFNNRQNSDRNILVRNTNNALRRNRRILEELNTSGTTKVRKEDLLRRGFNFNLMTSMYHTKTGKTYHFCYEHGYLAIEDGWYVLVIKKENID